MKAEVPCDTSHAVSRLTTASLGWYTPKSTMAKSVKPMKPSTGAMRMEVVMEQERHMKGARATRQHRLLVLLRGRGHLAFHQATHCASLRALAQAARSAASTAASAAWGLLVHRDTTTPPLPHRAAYTSMSTAVQVLAWSLAWAAWPAALAAAAASSCFLLSSMRLDSVARMWAR